MAGRRQEFRRAGRSPARRQCRLEDRLAGLGPIRHEAGNALVGQHMVEQGLDDGRRRGHHIGADLGAVEHVDRVTDRRDQDFGVERVIVVDQADVFDQLHAVEAIIIMTADEGRDEAGAGLGREQCLVSREAKGDVHHHAIVGQRLAGLEAVDGQRHLDADIGGDLPQDRGFLHHRLMVERDDLSRYRPVHDAADFLDHFQELAARLVDQRRVGGDAIQQAGGGQVTDFGNVGGVDEEFHGMLRGRIRESAPFSGWPMDWPSGRAPIALAIATLYLSRTGSGHDVCDTRI